MIPTGASRATRHPSRKRTTFQRNATRIAVVTRLMVSGPALQFCGERHGIPARPPRATQDRRGEDRSAAALVVHLGGQVAHQGDAMNIAQELKT
jgi:hypothetical protein